MKKINWIVINIVFIFISSTFISMKETIDKNLLTIGIVVIIITIINSIFYKNTNKYSLQIIGLNISMVLFFFGQCFAFLLGEKSLDIYYYSNNNQYLIIKTFLYSIKVYIFINIGIILSIKKSKEKNIEINKFKKNKNKFKKIINPMIVYNFSLIFLIVVTFLKSRYKGVNNLNLNYSFILLKWFLNFILLYICINTRKKGNEKYKTIFLIMSILLLFVGSRSTGIGLIISYILYEYSFENKRIRFKQISLLIAMLFMIPLLSYIRIGENFDIKLIKKIPILIFKELGFSVIPTIITIKNVPSLREFEYGRSLYDGIIRLIPFHQYFFKTMEYGENWVTKVANTDWGLGFSIVAETYLNFGNYGAIMGIVIGMFFGKYLIIKNNESFIEKYTMIISAPIIYFSVRSNLPYTLLNIFYFVILFKIIGIYTLNRFFNIGKNNNVIK